MRTRTAAWLAWSLWGLEMAFVAVTIAGALHHRLSRSDVATVVVFMIFVLAFSSVGALVASRRPENPIGWLLLGAAMSYTVGGITTNGHLVRHTDPHSLTALLYCPGSRGRRNAGLLK